MRYFVKNGIRMCEPDCADEWMDQIWLVGCDYDGCHTADELKGLIDELISYSLRARECLRDGKLFPNKNDN